MPHFIFIQQISVQNISNMLYNLQFFSSKCRLFHNATLFGFCITHILNTGCAKIWKKIRRQKVKEKSFETYCTEILSRMAQSVYWLCYSMVDPGFVIQQVSFLSYDVQTSFEAHTASYSMGTKGLPHHPPWTQQLRPEVDHSLPSCAEVKIPWNCTSTCMARSAMSSTFLLIYWPEK